MTPKDEYDWLCNIGFDKTVDSPLWPVFGKLTHLLEREIEEVKKAKREEKRMKAVWVSIPNSRWKRLVMTHPTRDVAEVTITTHSRATEGLSCALIIELSNEINSWRKFFRGQDLALIGPKINSVPWATLVTAAANYVRHRDEWREAGRKLNQRQIMSITPLKKVGIKNIAKGSATYLQIAKKLEIHEWESLQQRHSQWFSACLKRHPGRIQNS